MRLNCPHAAHRVLPQVPKGAGRAAAAAAARSKGELIFETVSRKAWDEWQALQTMIINERNLRLIDPEARQYLSEQMEKFLNNEPIDRIEGYRPPES